MFIQTDNNQWVRKNSEDCFTVIEITIYEDYCVSEIEVDLTKYSEKDIEAEINGYYDSLEQLKMEHPDEWKQIVAEIIAENTESDDEYDESFEDEDELYEYLKETYNIEVVVV